MFVLKQINWKEGHTKVDLYQKYLNIHISFLKKQRIIRLKMMNKSPLKMYGYEIFLIDTRH